MDALAAAAAGQAAARRRLQGRPEDAGRRHRRALERRRARRWRHRRLRLAGRAGAHQPSCGVRRHPVQQQGRAQPDRRRLHCRRSCRRAARQSGFPRAGHGGLRQGDRRRAEGRGRQDRAGLLRRCRPRQQGDRRRLRAGSRRPLQRGEHVLRHRLLPHQTAGTARHPPGLRTAPRDRQLWRRDRQFHVAAPHRRFHPAARLRGQGRQAGRLQPGQRALSRARAPVAGEGRTEGRRLRDAGRLPGHDIPAPHRRRIRRAGQLDAAGARGGIRPADRRDRSGRQAGCRREDALCRAAAVAEEQPQACRGRTGRPASQRCRARPRRGRTRHAGDRRGGEGAGGHRRACRFDRRRLGHARARTAAVPIRFAVPADARRDHPGTAARGIGQTGRRARERLPGARPRPDRRRPEAGAAPLCAGGGESPAHGLADALSAVAGRAAPARLRCRLRPHARRAETGTGCAVCEHETGRRGRTPVALRRSPRRQTDGGRSPDRPGGVAGTGAAGPGAGAQDPRRRAASSSPGVHACAVRLAPAARARAVPGCQRYPARELRQGGRILATRRRAVHAGDHGRRDRRKEHRPGAVRRAETIAGGDRERRFRRYRRSGAEDADGQLPHQPGHDRRQFGFTGTQRTWRTDRPELRQQLGIRQRQLPSDCCNSGCPICVHDLYAEQLQHYREQLAAWKQRHPEEPL